mmetsp:Transcript_18338/g.53306  ORF Transcript_18338/g.53306 Transcript_18338/m.53306 type:complete len:444 (+) Transcript_18338:54-1385(+)
MSRLVLLLLLSVAWRAAAATASSQPEAEACPDGMCYAYAEDLAAQQSLLQHQVTFVGPHSAAPAPPRATPVPARRTQAATGLVQARDVPRNQLPKAVVNLDLPPEQRWTDFYTANRDLFLSIIPSVEATEQKQPQEEVSAFARTIQLTPSDDEFLAELRGISAAFNDTRGAFDRLLYGVATYERGGVGLGGCTELLAAMPNGTMVHGRNLDVPDGATKQWDHIFDATYMRGGRPVFYATHFLGDVGVHTGFRVGAYSVAQNQRPSVRDSDLNWKANREGGVLYTLFIRRMIQEVGSFQQAVRDLAQVNLMAPMYFAVAGARPWEGALITRDRGVGPSEPWNHVDTVAPQINRWFLLQTNDDIWEEPTDIRRPEGIRFVEELGTAGVSMQGIQGIMSTIPILNLMTVFTVVTRPDTNERWVYRGMDELLNVTAEMNLTAEGTNS